jgi:hypothetical protein
MDRGRRRDGASAGQAALEAAVQTVLLSNPATALAGKGLTTLDGASAIVVSYTNELG